MEINFLFNVSYDTRGAYYTEGLLRVIIFDPRYTQAIVHASYNILQTQRGDNIRLKLHASYLSREQQYIMASSG